MKKENLIGLLTIFLFILIVTLTYGDQSMISPLLGAMTSYFGFGTDYTPMGVLTFSFTVLSAFSMVLFGILTDRHKRKWLCFFGAVIYSIFSIIVIIIPKGSLGFWAFFLIRVMSGIGFGAIIPTVFSLIGDMVSKEDRSKGYSFFSIATYLGQGIGVALASGLYQSIPDWRIPFLLIGIIILITALPLIFVKEPSRVGKQEVLEEIMLKKDEVVYTYRIKLSELKEIYKRKSNFWLIINFVDTIPTGIIIFLIFEFMQVEHNISQDQTTLLLVGILLSIVAGSILFGILGDKYFKKGHKRARVTLALIANLAPIPFIFPALLIPFWIPYGATILEIYSNPSVILMLILIMIGLFINGATAGNWYSTVVDVNLPEHRGTVLATANFFDIFGRALGPLIGSIVATNISLTAGMATSIIFWILIPFFWIPVMKNVIKDIDAVDVIFNQRLEEIKKSLK